MIGIKAAEHLSMSQETLRRWETQGRIKSQRTPGGHRRFDIKDVEDLLAKIKSGNFDSNEVRTAGKAEIPLPEEIVSNQPKPIAKKKVNLFIALIIGMSWAISVGGYPLASLFLMAILVAFLVVVGIETRPMNMKLPFVGMLVWMVCLIPVFFAANHQGDITRGQANKTLAQTIDAQANKASCSNARFEINKSGKTALDELNGQTISTILIAPERSRKGFIKAQEEKFSAKAKSLNQLC